MTTIRSNERKHMKDLSSISPFRFTPTDSVARGTSHISAGAIPAAPPCCTPKEIYDRVHQEISRRYLSFDQGKEMGFAGKAGVTGDIDFITKKDLIGILKKITFFFQKGVHRTTRKSMAKAFELIHSTTQTIGGIIH